MEFYIPHLRDRIRVVEDFTFPLHKECRNDYGIFGLSERVGLYAVNWPCDKITSVRTRHWGGKAEEYTHTEHVWHTIPVTIPAGTVLGIDRIFIRQGARDYDSVTFRSYGEGLPKGRFWIKLDDVNGMKFEKVEQ